MIYCMNSIQNTNICYRSYLWRCSSERIFCYCLLWDPIPPLKSPQRALKITRAATTVRQASSFFLIRRGVITIDIYNDVVWSVEEIKALLETIFIRIQQSNRRQSYVRVTRSAPLEGSRQMNDRRCCELLVFYVIYTWVIDGRFRKDQKHNKQLTFDHEFWWWFVEIWFGYHGMRWRPSAEHERQSTYSYG